MDFCKYYHSFMMSNKSGFTFYVLNVALEGKKISVIFEFFFLISMFFREIHTFIE